MHEVCELDRGMIPAAIICPATNDPTDTTWHRLAEVVGASPAILKILKSHGVQPPPTPAGYENSGPLLDKIITSVQQINDTWAHGDADGVNTNATALAQAPSADQSRPLSVGDQTQCRSALQPPDQPHHPRFDLLLIAFVLFLMAAQAQSRSLRIWGLRLMVVAFLIHTTGIAIRWWLVGGIFPPIKNEFESVMFSAWFGALVGLTLEFRNGKSFFGAAASFVGSMALLAIFAAPYVTGTQIGGEIGQVQGVLMSYWLYIHVTMVTASYALIGMGFALSSWWLIRYYRDEAKRRPPQNLRKSAGEPSANSARSRVRHPRRLHRRPKFCANPCHNAIRPSSRPAASVKAAALRHDRAHISRHARSVQSRRPSARFLDAGQRESCSAPSGRTKAGAVPGAGTPRKLSPWSRGWSISSPSMCDVVTREQAWWTAVLSCCGFFVMLFNWIGVNFFLVGLHSYA